MSKIKRLIASYAAYIAIPWRTDAAAAQRVLFCVYVDRDEMLRFLAKSDLAVKKIALVLGDEDQSLAFAGHLPNAGYDAFVSDPGMSVEVG